MRKHQLQVHKLTILSMMIALDVVLTPIFRIEGMAPMSSVVNILAGLFYKYGRKFHYSALGEILGTGIIGSIVSYPVMVLFTGSAAKLSWFIYTPRFFGATLIGTAISFIAFRFLIKQEFFKKVQGYFFSERID
ncbi:ThiW superfamily protein [Streptococcus pneumoniae]|nr:ThiW superfamily protein [Streptococcus pneumoniae]